MKMNDEEVAGMVTTMLTLAPACLERGQRSPEMVGKLLVQFLKRRSLGDVLEWLEENDTKLFEAVKIVKAHHSGDEKKCAALWQIVLCNLDCFEKQTGRWRLLDPIKSGDHLRQALREVSPKRIEKCENTGAC